MHTARSLVFSRWSWIPRQAKNHRDGIESVEGVLCIKDSWPGQMRTVWGDHERFEKTYFSDYKGYYFTGDGCRRDADGYYWITGRVDDVINVSGHRMGTAEVESALVAHSEGVGGSRCGLSASDQGAGYLLPMSPLMAGEEPMPMICVKELSRHGCAKEIGPDRKTRSDPVGAGPAQDPIRQDYAADPAQDCGG